MTLPNALLCYFLCCGSFGRGWPVLSASYTSFPMLFCRYQRCICHLTLIWACPFEISLFRESLWPCGTIGLARLSCHGCDRWWIWCLVTVLASGSWAWITLLDFCGLGPTLTSSLYVFFLCVHIKTRRISGITNLIEVNWWWTPLSQFFRGACSRPWVCRWISSFPYTFGSPWYRAPSTMGHLEPQYFDLATVSLYHPPKVYPASSSWQS